MRLLPWKRKDRAPARLPFDESETRWLAQARRPFNDFCVGSLVPTGYERYARILHPAWAAPPRPWQDPSVAIRWDAVALWSGKRTHPLVQWVPLADPADDRPVGARPFDTPPNDGHLPKAQLEVLCGHLDAATTTPGRCFLAQWEGYGGLTDFWSEARLLKLDQRGFLVLEGPLALVSGPEEPPTLIWPADRAWFMASDTDLDSTYVGGSRATIDAILGDDRLEAWPATATDDVTAASDTINR